MFLTSFLYRHLPYPGPLVDRFGDNLIIRAYRNWHLCAEVNLKRWHRKRLREVDADFDFNEDQYALVKARETARKNGIKPSDPLYPTLGDFRKATKFRKLLD